MNRATEADAPAADAQPAERLATWERSTFPIIVVAAILPLAAGFVGVRGDDPIFWLDFASWVVFAVDLVVHVRLAPRYLSTWQGRVDLAIVVFTFPWYVIPAFDNASFLSVFRVVRLLRLLLVGPVMKRIGYLFHKLRGVGTVALATVFTAGIIVYRVEPEGSGFDTLWDGMWWATVTLTTVGYGDLVPESTAGRVTAVLVMVVGLAVLGALAGALASMFNVEDSDRRGVEQAEAEIDVMEEQIEHVPRASDEIRDQLAEMNRRLADLAGDRE
jgi:voltage-gated potassium channel